MSGRVGDLSPKQAEALEQFKINLKDVLQPHHDDHYLLRWLRARRFDLKKSEKMLRDSLTWRKLHRVDHILEEWEPPEVLVKYYPGGVSGFDKEGCPVWIDILGPVDLKGMFYSVKKSDIIKYKVYWTEKIFKMFREQTEKLGKRVDQCGLLFDMDGIGLKHLWKPVVDLFTSIMAMYEANYPETLKYSYVLNAPSIFPIAYNLAKPFLSEDTKKKIRVLGKDWKEIILQDIPAESLPKHWGGTMMEGDDEYCQSQICMGGEIPESMYIQKVNFVDVSGFTTQTVGRGSSLQLDYEVSQKGYIIRWQFSTDSNDIGFGVFLRTNDSRQKAGEMKEVVPSQRVNSHIIPENGSHTCLEPGTYVVRFDNTYSWVKAKQVSFLIEILEPDDIKELSKSASYESQLLTERL